jgi:hypothetical protein
MRLKEPLQGVKMCQGHNIIHWSFFVAMCFFMDSDPEPEAANFVDDEHFMEA